MNRIGQGYDIHPFVSGKPLRLGGVDIPHEQGLKGHSDADVVLHAICDALLGAAALGDIGEHFSDQDAQFANADSRVFLRHCQQLILQQGYQVGNIDVTIIAEMPKLSPYKQAIRETIASDLAITAQQINIKATTHEKLGSLGRAEGIASLAVALLTTGNNHE